MRILKKVGTYHRRGLPNPLPPTRQNYRVNQERTDELLSVELPIELAERKELTEFTEPTELLSPLDSLRYIVSARELLRTTDILSPMGFDSSMELRPKNLELTPIENRMLGCLN